MADSDKNILITPNRGSSSQDPKIEFTGGDNNTVTLTTLDDGTLSFTGSAGQLFSISDSLTGTIFSVNDASGIPSIEVEDSGLISLAEFSGNVVIGSSTDDGNKLQISGGGVSVGGTNVINSSGEWIGPGGSSGGNYVTTNTAQTITGVKTFAADVTVSGNRSATFYAFNGAYINGSTDVRAPIFYDRGDTSYYANLNDTSRIYGLDVVKKRTNFGTGTDWDAINFSRQTNIHFQAHNQFWIGAGNGTWFTGAANTKSQASGLAADASRAHDLLITTMQSTSTYDRGITFAVDSTGAGTSGWRLGKWHSGDARDASILAIDGMLRVHGAYTDEYDYYANDYSAYYSKGQSYWAGDTNAGWHRPSATFSSAIQIQSGNGGTNSRKPQIQFHQYGYGGPGIEYDGPNKKFTFGELGTSNPDRVNTFEFRFDNTIRARINSDYMFHNSDIRSPIFYDSNNTGYYIHGDSTSLLYRLELNNKLDFRGQTGTWIESNQMTDSIGWNTSHGVYIGSDVGGTHYLRANGKFTTGGNTYDLWHTGNLKVGWTGTGYFNNGGSTDNFKQELSDYGHRSQGFRAHKTGWSYAGNSDVATGHNGITLEMAGSSIATWSDGNHYTSMVIRPTTGTGGSNVMIYNDQGSSYSPGWRQVWTSGVTCYNNVDIRAPILYDVNNTGYYVNPEGDSRVGRLLVGDGSSYIRIGDEGEGYNSSYARIRTNSSGDLYLDQKDGRNIYLSWYTGTSARVYSEAGAQFPIYYDRNDTNYYVDPSSTSSLYKIWVKGSAANTAPRWDTSFHVVQSQHWYGHNASQTMYLGESGNKTRIRGTLNVGSDADAASGYGMSIRNSLHMHNTNIDYVNQLHFNANVRFYDEGNDNYLNFKWGDSGSGGIKFYDGDNVRHGYIYGDGAGKFGFLDNDGHWAVRIQTGTSPLELRCNNNVEFYVYDSYTLSPGSSRAPIFYDSNNTGFYMDPASTSVVNAVKFYGDFYHDTSNRDNGMFGSYDSYKTDHIWSMGTAYRNHASGANFGNLYGLAYKHTNNGTGGTMASGHQMVWCQNGSPKAAMGTNIWTSGNVTAYSDARVKTNLEVIPEAVDKVKSLTGYTFDRTDVTYDEHGEAEVPVRQTGIIAQDLLKVLPEAVTGGPTEKDPDGHYSVAYGNLAGLLIEAIKEQQQQIEDLKSEIESLKM